MQQGDLDAACGLYAGIHACQIVTGVDSGYLSDALHQIISCQEFRLRESVVRKLLDPTSGTTIDELKHILKNMTGVINKLRGKYGLTKDKELSFVGYDMFGGKRGNIRGVFTRVHQLFKQAEKVCLGYCCNWSWLLSEISYSTSFSFQEMTEIALVIGVTGHWTTIEKATEAQWQLVDSGNMLQMKRGHWNAGEVEDGTKEVYRYAYIVRFV